MGAKNKLLYQKDISLHIFLALAVDTYLSAPQQEKNPIQLASKMMTYERVIVSSCSSTEKCKAKKILFPPLLLSDAQGAGLPPMVVSSTLMLQSNRPVLVSGSADLSVCLPHKIALGQHMHAFSVRGFKVCPQIIVPGSTDFQLYHPVAVPKARAPPQTGAQKKSASAHGGQATEDISPDLIQNIRQYDLTKARAERMEWSLKLCQIEKLCIPALSKVNPSVVRPWVSMECQGDNHSFMTGLQAKYMWYQLQLDAAVGNLSLVVEDRKIGFWGIVKIHATQSQIARCRRNEIPFIENHMPRKVAKTLYAIWKRIGFRHSIKRPKSGHGITLHFQANKVGWTKKKAKDCKACEAYDVDDVDDAQNALDADNTADTDVAMDNEDAEDIAMDNEDAEDIAMDNKAAKDIAMDNKAAKDIAMDNEDAGDIHNSDTDVADNDNGKLPEHAQINDQVSERRNHSADYMVSKLLQAASALG